MKLLFTLCLFISCKVLFAQPVVAKRNFNPINTRINYYEGNINNYKEVNGDINQVWDFSGISVSLINDLDFYPWENNDENFQSATFKSEPSVSQGDFTYYKVTDNYFTYLGFITNSCGTPVIGKYGDTWNMYSLPLKYNDTYNDSFSSTSKVIFEGDTADNFFKANYSYKVDGYGKLITPFKTYTHVLRVNATITGRDSSVHHGTTDTTLVNSYVSRRVSWISSDEGDFWEQVTTPDYKTFYFSSIESVLNVEKNFSAEKIKIYPQPANDFINLEMSLTGNEKINIILYNNLGVVVRSKHDYINHGKIYIGDLTPGFYFLVMTSNDHEWKRKVLIER